MSKSHRVAVVLLLAVTAVLSVAAPAGAKSPRKLPQCVVPKLKGDTLTTATKALTKAHCALGKITNPKIPTGFKETALLVSAQSVKAGRREKKGTKVSVTLKAKLVQLLTSTSAAVNVESDSDDQGVFALISALVFEGTTATNGLPVTFTITDGTTGQALATFQGTSNGLVNCSVRMSLSADFLTQMWTGTAVVPYAACSLTSVSLPAADTPLIAVSYGGSSTLAPSSSDDTTAL